MPRFGNLDTQFLDDSGNPLISGLINFYEPGTTTRKNTYADVNMTIANSNPVELTAAGRLDHDVYYSGSIDAKLTTSAGVQVKTHQSMGSSDGAVFEEYSSGLSYSSGDIVTYSSKYYRSLSNGNQGNTPSTSSAYWEEFKFIGTWNTNTSYAVDDLVNDGGVIFRCRTANSGNQPSTDDGTNWVNVAHDIGDVVVSGDSSRHGTPAWLPCNGSSYDSTTYAALLAKIGRAPVEIAFGGTTTANPTETEYAPSGTYMAISGSAQLEAYKLVGDTYSDLTSNMPSANYESLCWSNDGVWLVGGRNNTPFIQISKRSGDTFTLQSNPGTLPGTHVYAVAFDNTDTYLFCADSAGNVELYSRSGDVFTSITAPTGLSGTPRDIAAHPSADYFAVVTNSSPYLYVFKGDGAGTYTKLANPSNLPGGNSYGVAWNNDGTKLAVAFQAASPYLIVYSFDSGTDTFTKLDDPDILPESNLHDLAFSPDGTVLTCIPQTAGVILQYTVGASSLTLKRKITPSNGTGSMNGVAYSPDGLHIMTVGTNGGSNNTPYKNSVVTPNLDDNMDEYYLVKAYVRTGL